MTSQSVELVGDVAPTSSAERTSLSSVGSSIVVLKSTILDDRSYLRGVSASIVLAKCGLLLGRPALGSQYRMTLEEGEALYAASHEVRSIDWFISHSWRDGRFQKYLAIICFLNHDCAVVGANTMSALWVLAEFLAMPLPTLDGKGGNGKVGHVRYIFCITFILLLVVGQWLTGYSRDPEFFRDKTCIHQLDPIRKAKGIAKLGGFLRFSRRMLILWSPDYFDRLWCNYEIACFTALAGVDKIDFVPLNLLRDVVTMLLMYILLGVFGDEVVSRWRHVFEEIGFDLIWYLTKRLAVFIGVMQIIRLARLREELRRQVSSFNWDRARCYCCDIGHRLPDTGEIIPCDRILVERNITKFFQRATQSGETGLNAFERSVREDLAANVRRLLEPTLFSLSQWAAVVSFTVWEQVEYIVVNPGIHPRRRLLAVRTPLPLFYVFFYLLQATAAFIQNRTRSRRPVLIDACIALIFFPIFMLSQSAVNKLSKNLLRNHGIWSLVMVYIAFVATGWGISQSLPYIERHFTSTRQGRGRENAP